MFFIILDVGYSVFVCIFFYDFRVGSRVNVWDLELKDLNFIIWFFVCRRYSFIWVINFLSFYLLYEK